MQSHGDDDYFERQLTLPRVRSEPRLDPVTAPISTRRLLKRAEWSNSSMVLMTTLKDSLHHLGFDHSRLGLDPATAQI